MFVEYGLEDWEDCGPGRGGKRPLAWPLEGRPADTWAGARRCPLGLDCRPRRRFALRLAPVRDVRIRVRRATPRGCLWVPGA